MNIANLRIIAMLCLVVSVGRFSFDSYLPSLPAMTSIFHTTSAQIQLTLTYYFFGYGISQFFYGPLSEKYGRRIFLLIGIIIFITGCLLCATTYSINTFILGRFLSGLGAGAGGVLARAIITDFFPGELIASAWSQVTTSIVLSLMIGPVIGGLNEEYLNFRYTFWLNLLYGLFVLILLLIWFPETHHNRKNISLKMNKIFFTYFNIIKDHHFIIYILCSTLAFSCLVSFFQLSPFIFISQFGYTPITYGLTLIWIACNYILGGKIVGLCSKTFDSNSMIFYGAILIFIASLLLICFHSICPSHDTYNAIIFFVASSLFVIGARIVIPTGLGAGLQHYRHIAGYAAAISGGGQMLGSTLISYGITKFFWGTPFYRLSFSLFNLSLLILFLLTSLMILKKSTNSTAS